MVLSFPSHSVFRWTTKQPKCSIHSRKSKNSTQHTLNNSPNCTMWHNSLADVTSYSIRILRAWKFWIICLISMIDYRHFYGKRLTIKQFLFCSTKWNWLMESLVISSTLQNIIQVKFQNIYLAFVIEEHCFDLEFVIRRRNIRKNTKREKNVVIIVYKLSLWKWRQKVTSFRNWRGKTYVVIRQS